MKKRHPRAKLTDYEIVSIREAYNDFGISSIKLAKWYGVSVSTVLSIAKRKTWKHVK